VSLYDRTMSSRRLLLLLTVCLAGCSSTSHAALEHVRDGLVSGDQQGVDAFTHWFLTHGSGPAADALMNDRLVSRGIVIRVDEPNRVHQYGVDRVSDYFMCLLQMKHRTSSTSILSEDVRRSKCGSAGECEACNSLTYPLPESVRQDLRTYWLRRLELRSSERDVSGKVPADIAHDDPEPKRTGADKLRPPL
jgi:hypothetical protein